MADQREGGISWTDETWNPIRGCSRVSEGCRHCYAETVAVRFDRPGMAYEGLTTNGKWNGTVRFIEDHLLDPLRWRRPRRIFVNSMSDLFHESLSFDDIDRIVAVMALAQQHTFQVLTKRPARMAEYLTNGGEGRGLPVRSNRYLTRRQVIAETIVQMRTANIASVIDWEAFEEPANLQQWPLPNVWWGFSAEDQPTLNKRATEAIRAINEMAVFWLSAEPLLGPMDVRPWLPHERELSQTSSAWIKGLNLVVAGGESNSDRYLRAAWAQRLRDHCREYGVPFHFKQWGDWIPIAWLPDTAESHRRQDLTSVQDPEDPTIGYLRVGKKAAGRLLDGTTHDDMPAMPAGR